MNNIAHKAIVLKLNKGWKPVGVELVSKTICDLMTGVIEALDIQYELKEDGSPDFDAYQPIPCTWEQWIKLPVRPWDLSIHSSKMVIRVPTVVIAQNYAKVPEKKFKGKPTKEGLAIRDNMRDAYTGEELDFEEATIDHVIPRSRGGTDTYDNTVLTTKKINNAKGSKLNHEAGLKLLFAPHQPKPIKVSQTIRRARHHDWKHFLEAPSIR
jgi:5-methylcytosine-specific restriction endonuclease McrA